MLDQLLQRRSTPLRLRRQDARRGLCYPGKRGEIGGVIEPRIYLSKAAILFRKTGPPLTSARIPMTSLDEHIAQYCEFRRQIFADLNEYTFGRRRTSDLSRGAWRDTTADTV